MRTTRFSATLVATLLTLGLATGTIAPAYADPDSGAPAVPPAADTQPVPPEQVSEAPADAPESPSPSPDPVDPEASAPVAAPLGATSAPPSSPTQSETQAEAPSVAPTMVRGTCTEPGTLTIPVVDGASWTIDGVPAYPGTHEIDDGSTIEVKATATSAGVLPDAPRDSFTGKWTLRWTFSFPFPECAPPSYTVRPAVTSVAVTCDADGSFTLPSTTGVVWTVNGVTTAPGTYSAPAGSVQNVVAATFAPFVFASGAQTSWTLDFTPPSGCLTLQGSGVTGLCDADSPWISYDVVLTDPFAQTTGYDAELIMSGGAGEEVRIPLGTVDPATGLLSGRVLWPGASVDPVTGEANGWPGWEFVGGEWRETTGNFAWTRTITQAILSVNPEMTVVLHYPEATPSCVMTPPTPRVDAGARFPTSVTLAQECSDAGRGVVTFGLVNGVSYFAGVRYFIEGVPVLQPVVELDPGTYRVTASPMFTTDRLVGPTAWTITVDDGDSCGAVAVSALAATGATPGGAVSIVAVLFAAGATAMVVSWLARRRQAGSAD